MSERIKQVAERIKGLREISKATVDEMARELKVSKEEYKKYESGRADIPVSFLYEIAHKFNVELTALLTGEEPHMHTYSIVRGDKAPSVDRRKEYKYKDLAYNFAHKKAEIFLVNVDPAPSKRKPHYYGHPGQEFNYVLKGSLKVMLDGHEITLNEGDSLYFDSGKKHAMYALKGKPAKFLAVIL